ncbi:MAG TPA: AAA family ATPase [Candidatus Paceibacterota bacterium]|jgi:dephospho-CoA kinase|nr:AAA family ATPase [Candidatus Paceibacterota bacterium]
MIIGITGSFGAGKGAVVDYLVREKGFADFSARNFIAKEIKHRGLPVNRDTLTNTANDIREKHGATYIIESLYNEAKERGGDAVVESLRAVAEVRLIKKLGGLVLGIDAPPQVRYERARARGSETDNVPYEEWLQQEVRESNPNEPTKQNIFGALSESDVIIENSGSLEELYEKVDHMLKEQRLA